MTLMYSVSIQRIYSLSAPSMCTHRMRKFWFLIWSHKIQSTIPVDGSENNLLTQSSPFVKTEDFVSSLFPRL